MLSALLCGACLVYAPMIMVSLVLVHKYWLAWEYQIECRKCFSFARAYLIIAGLALLWPITFVMAIQGCIAIEDAVRKKREFLGLVKDGSLMYQNDNYN